MQIELVVPPLTPAQARSTGRRCVRRSTNRDRRATQIVAAGVKAQEYQFLDLAMRRELIRRTVEYAAGRVPVMVGISHPDPACERNLRAWRETRAF
jgi:4-hydroxy-tetrahydrodipicolinate synthase